MKFASSQGVDGQDLSARSLGRDRGRFQSSSDVAGARRRRITTALSVLSVLLITLSTAVLLHALGRNATCTCGDLHVWWGAADGPGNSQHLSDWYSLLHVGHGILTWPLLKWLAPQWSLRKSLPIALHMGAGWEVVENTPFMIARFGESGPGAYPGDSIVNSLSDMAFGIAGFLAARQVGVRAGMVLLVVLELSVTSAIDDGFILGATRLAVPQAVQADQ